MVDFGDELARLKDQGKDEYDKRFGETNQQDENADEMRDDQGTAQQDDM